MMGFQPVLLWSDILVWDWWRPAAASSGWSPGARPSFRLAPGGASPVGMAAATVLLAFVAVGLLDSVHHRPRLKGSPASRPPMRLRSSLFDALAAPPVAAREDLFGTLRHPPLCQETLTCRVADR